MEKTISCTKKITPIGISLSAMWMMLIVVFTFPRSASANVMCEWFGYCVYESPAFELKVVDKETGQPLANVHALAAWLQFSYHGIGGPLMAQDATSGHDGILAFSKWGPLRGSRAGLSLNQDPVIILFKSGYLPLLLNNHPGRDERARIRGFTQNGQTFQMEVFTGNTTVWVKELTYAAFPPQIGLSGKEPELIRGVFINRYRIVQTEAQKLPQARTDVFLLTDELQRGIQFLEEGGKQ